VSHETTPLVTRLADTFVGEVKEPPITPETIRDMGRSIYEAYLDHKVLVFKSQDITPRTFADFGTIFGRPEEHHVLKLRHPEESTLTLISNQDEPDRPQEMKTSGQGWHSDYSYKLVPGSATMLHGVEIPGHGGDTLFADAEAAFAALPE